MPTGDFPDPEGMIWTDAFGWIPKDRPGVRPEVGNELFERDHERGNKWSWGRDYGKDILTDLNMLAHARGTGPLFRDALQRAYAEIARLRKRI